MSTPTEIITKSKSDDHVTPLQFPSDLSGNNPDNRHYVSFEFYDELRARTTEAIAKPAIAIIALPIPAGVGNNITASYNNQQLSFGENLVYDFTRGNIDSANYESGVKNLAKHDLQNVEGIIGQVAFRTLKGLSTYTSAAIAGTSNAVRSFVAQEFENMGLREFGLRWRLVASSAQEAATLRKIEFAIKSAMNPTINSDYGGFGGGLVRYPSKVTVRFMSGDSENLSYPRYMPCIVTSFSAVYNPSITSMHEDDSPTEVEMAISFRETVMLTREDFERPAEDSPDQNRSKGVR